MILRFLQRKYQNLIKTELKLIERYSISAMEEKKP